MNHQSVIDHEHSACPIVVWGQFRKQHSQNEIEILTHLLRIGNLEIKRGGGM